MTLIIALLVIVLALLLAALMVYFRNKFIDRKTPDEIKSYFNHLLSEYEAFPSDDVPEEYRNEIEKIIERERSSALTWDDNFRFELMLLRVQPPEKLKRKAWLIRDRYSDIVPQKRYQAYLDSNPPSAEIETIEERLEKLMQSAAGEGGFRIDLTGILGEINEPSGMNLDELRADLEVILQNLFWHYSIRTAWERQRDFYSKCFLWIYLGLTIFGVGSIASLLYFPPDFTETYHPIFTLFAVAFMGAVGGFVSMIRRLQKIPTESVQVRLIEMEHGRYGILFQSMISGAIFATVLLIVFGGGLLKGDLFPNYSANNRTGGIGFIDFLRNASSDSVQFGKLLVWSFIAGFAERLVPDFLDHLAAKGKDADDKKGK